MPRLAWLTDIHLNFLDGDPQRLNTFFQQIHDTGADIILLGGDIGEANDVVDYLFRLDDALARPIYFVLGNHDFYHASIRQVRARMAAVCRQRPRLCYLTDAGVVELAPSVALVGHDGWADARIGDYQRSTVMMNDYQLIEELAHLDDCQRQLRLHALGDAAAAHAREILPQALANHAHVVFLTHVPPVKEACRHQGEVANGEWTPHFTCRAMGDALIEIMTAWPDRKLTVLCGHTHNRAEHWPLPNMMVLTGGAEYGMPEVQRIFEL